jgi:hypothetical protein
MYASNDFKFHVVRLVMLVLNSNERWRVERVRFSNFVCKSMLSGVPFTLFQLQFIIMGSIRFVVILSKEISSEDFESK